MTAVFRSSSAINILPTINDKSWLDFHYYQDLLAVNDLQIRWKNIFLSYPPFHIFHIYRIHFSSVLRRLGSLLELLCQLDLFGKYLFLRSTHAIVSCFTVATRKIYVAWCIWLFYGYFHLTVFLYAHTKNKQNNHCRKKAIIPSFYALATKHLFNNSSFTKFFSL